MGSPYPRVTAILEAVGLAPNFNGVAKATLEAARARGSRVHRYLEDDHYRLDPNVLPEDWGYYQAYKAFVVESGHEPLISEFEVEHPEWRYSGHPDRLGWLVGQRCLIDYKTGVFDPVYTARQLCLYRLAWNAMHPDQAVSLTCGLELRVDGSYRLHELDSKAEEVVCFAAVTIYHAKEKR